MKRIDRGEFQNESIVAASPYGGGFVVFTTKAIYFMRDKKALNRVKLVPPLKKKKKK